MSFLIAAPELVSAAATDLSRVGSSITAANAAAAAPTTAVIAAGADEVSAAIAALFGSHARWYQQLSTQAAAFHAQFVQALNAVLLAIRPPRPLTRRLCRPWSKERWPRSMRRCRPYSIAH